MSFLRLIARIGANLAFIGGHPRAFLGVLARGGLSSLGLALRAGMAEVMSNERERVIVVGGGVVGAAFADFGGPGGR